MKKKLLLLLLPLCVAVIQSRSQESKTKVNLNQSDARLYVEMEYSESAALGFQWVSIAVTNNTNDKLNVKLEYTVHGVNGDTKSMFVGGWGSTAATYTGKIIEPGKKVWGDNNNCLMQYYGKCKDKGLKTASGISCINYVSYRIISIENITEKENAAKKAEEEKLRIEQAKKDATAKKESDSKTATQQNTQSNTTNGNLSQTATNTKAVAESTSTSSVQSAQQAEAEQLQQKQNEYDTWKQQMQDQSNRADVAKASASLALFTILGGFIYKNMGKVEPGKEYQSPKKGEKPYKVFFNSTFGFSTTTTPLLYESIISTMVNGVATTKYFVKGDEIFYLNLGADIKLGVTSDHYSYYGGFGGKFGIDPTLHGSQMVSLINGGAEYGLKQMKAYGRYTLNFSDEKKLKPTNIEDKGVADFNKSSTELEYGVKFTTAGNPSNNYKRTHIYFGVITKMFNFGGINDGTTSFYFDPITKYGYETGKKSISGFNIEIKQDHNFKFFIRGFSKHLYIGKLRYGGYAGPNAIPKISATVDKGTSGFFEFGFLRSIDFF